MIDGPFERSLQNTSLFTLNMALAFDAFEHSKLLWAGMAVQADPDECLRARGQEMQMVAERELSLHWRGCEELGITA